MKKINRPAVQAKSNKSRRKFLTQAIAASGAAMAAVPMRVKAQAPAVVRGPIVLRWQSTWPAKDIFHEYALDYAKKVNDMSSGKLKIELLPAGALVKAFDLIDAVSKGTLDGGHGVTAYWYRKNAALGLWGSGPAFGMDANMVLAWHNYGGGKLLLEEIYKNLNLDVVSLLYGPMPTQPLGWFKNPVTRTEDIKGLKFRTTGLAVDLFNGMGGTVSALEGDEIVPAVSKGQLDAAAFNNASSDRMLGLPGVSKVCMLQSYHQPGEQFEILFNKKKYGALPAELKAMLSTAAEAASADMSWKAIHQYSLDYIELESANKVKFYKTPDAVLQRQLQVWDGIAAKKSNENPMFKRVFDSQRAFAQRALRWQQDTLVGSRMAYNHFFTSKKG